MDSLTPTCKIIQYEPNKEENVKDIEESVSMVEDIFPLPKNILKHIQIIQEMRKSANAPVDTMGCHLLADPAADPKVTYFFILVLIY